MKAKIMTLVLCLFLYIYVDAQQKTDYYFYSTNSDYLERCGFNPMISFRAVEDFRFQNMTIEEAPINGGFMILFVFGLSYCVLKRKENVR